MRSYISSLMLQCDKARHDELSDEEQNALADECMGLCSIPIFGRAINTYANQHDWSKLRGALAPLLQIETGDRVNVTQNTTATANVDVSQTVTIIQSLPDSTLSDADKDVLAGMLVNLQNLEGDSKKSKLMEIIKWLGDKAVDVSIAVIPILAGML